VTLDADRTVLARARTDADDRLVEADEPLAGLQRRCGGDLPGTIAAPQLLEVVRKARTLKLKLARTITATDGDDTIRAWVEVTPDDGAEDGCSIAVGAWTIAPKARESEEVSAARRIEIDRQIAELTARLDPAQRPIAVEVHAPDLLDRDRVGERVHPCSMGRAVLRPAQRGHGPQRSSLWDSRTQAARASSFCS